MEEKTRESMLKTIAWGADPYNLTLWGREFFPDAIRGDVQEIHRNICRWMYSPKKCVYITIPRGRGKTMWVRVFLAHSIIYHTLWAPDNSIQVLNRYIAYKGETRDDKAKQTLRRLKDNFEHNQKLIDHYGQMKDENEFSPSKLRFVRTNERGNRFTIVVQPFGGDQSTRGGLEGDWRYTLIIVDDPDGLKESKSPLIMADHWEKIKRDDIKALDPIYGRIRLLGTVLSKECCIQRAIDDSKKKKPQWSGVIYEGLDANGQSVWEEYHPTAQIEEERVQALEDNEYGFWLSENMNKLIDEKMQKFKRRYFRYWAGYVKFNEETERLELVIEELFHIKDKERIDLFEEDETSRAVPIYCYLGIDPAGEASKPGTSDFYAIVTIALDPDGNFYVLDYIRDRLTTVEFHNHLFRLNKIYRYRMAKFESNAGFSATESVTRQEMIRREKENPGENNFVPMLWKKNTEPKPERIEAMLLGPWQAGAIYHKRDMHRLEEEAELHGNIAHEDVMDAFQMAMSVAQARPIIKKEKKPDVDRRRGRWPDEEERKKSWSVA